MPDVLHLSYTQNVGYLKMGDAVKKDTAFDMLHYVLMSFAVYLFGMTLVKTEISDVIDAIKKCKEVGVEKARIEAEIDDFDTFVRSTEATSFTRTKVELDAVYQTLVSLL
ncbi:MAG: hypothetical protein Q4F61_01770 [Candidatus Saccharibacteria bacterium]|nr:hypothetical protein [Candidatus Saccharibacteria bacterium]